MIYQSLFTEKNKENGSSCCLLKFYPACLELNLMNIHNICLCVKTVCCTNIYDICYGTVG